MSGCNHVGNYFVGVPIVENARRSYLALGPLNPEREVNLNGLRDFGLVRQHPDTRMELESAQGDERLVVSDFRSQGRLATTS